jgi:hypothetical protein
MGPVVGFRYEIPFFFMVVLPLPQGNHVAKFVKDPIYRTKVIVQK